jgi:thymidylate synthase
MALVDYQYLKAVHDTLKSEVRYLDRKRLVDCIQSPRIIMDVAIDEVPILTVKKVSAKNVATELLWFLRGDTSIKFLIENKCTIWNDDAYNLHKKFIHDKEKWERGEDFAAFYSVGNSYPKQWRHHNYDQFEQIVQGMINDIWNRRLLCNSWSANDINNMALPPCHFAWEIIPYDDDLFALNWFQRSCDLMLGIPYNILSYYFLGKILEELTSKTFVGLTGYLSNVHIYEPHIGNANKLLSNEIHDAGEFRFSDNALVLFSKWRQGGIELNALIKSLTPSDFIVEDYNHSGTVKFDLLTPEN